MTHDVDIDRMDARINALGASLLFDPVTLATAAERGVEDPVVLYAGGRAGVMGDVTAPVVRAVFGFFAPTAVEEVWPTVLAAARPSHLAEVYAASMADAARAHWDPEASAVVARHGRVVVDGAPALGLPLFSAWRAVAVPEDAAGAAALTVTALRELRGDVHVGSVGAAGVDPHVAEVATRGPAGCRLHGWPEPDPDPAPSCDALAGADAATSARMRAIWSVLDPAELAAVDDAVAALAP